MTSPACGVAASSGGGPSPSPPNAAVQGGDTVVLGIVLCELAVTLIALGANIQRYGLTVVDPQRRFLCRGCSCANTVWFAGLATYFLGNILFFGALSLAPASLCAALLATVVVVNAALSRLILKEKLQRCDYHGGALIVAGAQQAASRQQPPPPTSSS